MATSIISREDVLRSTADRITELEARQQQLLQEVANVDRELGVTRAQHKQALNDGALVSAFPFEILASIFRHCQGNWTPHRRPVELDISHVSSTWRTVALGTAQLWTYIHVHMAATKYNQSPTMITRKLALLAMYLERSSQASLRIRLEASGNFMWTEALGQCASHLWRCTEFSVSAKFNFSPIEPILECLRNLRAERLRYLSVRICYYPHTPHLVEQFLSTSPAIFTLGAPSLCFARLAGVAGPLQPPLQSVTTLSIDGTNMTEVSLVQLGALLESAPQLVNLSLTRMGLLQQPGSIPLSSSPLCLPNLRHIRICGDRDENQDRSYQILQRLPLEHIETLVLREIPGLADCTFPRVRSLSVTDCSFPTNQLEHTVDAFPALVNLDCDLVIVTPLLILSWDGDETNRDLAVAFWSKVERLSIREMDARHARLLIRCVESRKRRGVPIKSLVLDTRSRKVLRTVGLLEELEGHVLIEEYDDESWPAGDAFQDNDDSFWD
ncbi:hypothetical protein CYLTODRAFT_440638 [Cylindrobasidium torrendii FP15055 ss-10]|uniref:F-box domain-containing protein n=1 Tax=Cylindrobasidium torrendii FP15055 ss-10 TaxID=1314674 RepID=A0A0D7BPB5_9AGAR|nr:hypothetical protein CYLTODRAFT_440638 [Cylindrobasidium torrendii FP15055 ss-10]